MGTFVHMALQAGWKVHTPNELPVEQVTPEGVFAMLPTVPPEADAGAVAAAKALVLASAQQLQVRAVEAPAGGGCAGGRRQQCES